ncbi:hypothetical protein NC797_08695 [Aquibacillus sp. 3ASR75-11]|uniref:Uncharacterized protein n=1 Tax=Terrihalobacillus insolitus TaxID=2950438 RepID=A0A9X4ALT2_9BACI|nr:hypothetical protein [Terrihalobacillus insolitus]MDC3424586.1 hypothetical protein [Terrihalobacillus insolitus]
MNNAQIEKLLWSIALPGFAQLLNRKYIKGIIFIILEFIVNIKSNFNLAILFSFHGDIVTAIEKTNYQWLMFYPCLYFFAMWDAIKDADGRTSPFSLLPFVTTAYFVTIGLIYSPKIKIFGILLGPVFSPILFIIPGFFIGFLILKIIKQVT